LALPGNDKMSVSGIGASVPSQDSRIRKLRVALVRRLIDQPSARADRWNWSMSALA
jgi:hypothetical protein